MRMIKLILRVICMDLGVERKYLNMIKFGVLSSYLKFGGDTIQI